MTANITNRDEKEKIVKAGNEIKVGDLVKVSRCRLDYEYFSKGDIGTVVDYGPGKVFVNFTKTGKHPMNPKVKGGGLWWVGIDSGNSSFQLAEPAPTSARVDLPLLIFERDGLLDEVARLKAEANERANAYSQKVQGVRAELIDALSTADAEHSALLEARKQLEDIAALRRSESIMRHLKENASFADAIDAVLEGKVAA